MVGAFFVLLVLWLFISQWLRVTVFVSAMVVWLAVSPLLPAFTLWPSGQPTTAAATTAQANTGANAAAGSQPDQLAERFLCRRAEAQDAVPGPAAGGCAAV